MEIALLGGTGDIGEGLALRFAAETNHDVVIGSRERDRAEGKAREYEAELDSRGIGADVGSGENSAVAAAADVVILAVPAYHLADTVAEIADAVDDETILVTPAVGMQRDEDGFHYNEPADGSVTELAANAAPEGAPVVGAYHNLPAARLANLDADLGIDTVIVGDDEDAVDIVTRITEDVEGLRAVDGGPLANAAEIEAVTPLLINVAQYNDGLHDLGIRFD